MNIGLLGFGVVGRGVYDMLAGRDDIRAAWVLCRRDLGELTARTTYEMQDILDDPAVDTVVEVMGGLHPAYEYVAAALRAGKNVVSSNKYLMCRYYDELTALAKEHGAALRCTAAVGGGIPWLTNLEKAARANHISRVWGILNGTTNYIMDAMHSSDADFADVLAQAQALGYAEADPSADIDGLDIQRKLILSANVAFGVSLREADVPVFGIRNVRKADIARFQAHSCTCKLIATAEQRGGSIRAYVEPTLLGRDALEAAVPANFNLISIAKTGMSSSVGMFRQVFEVFERHGVSIEYAPSGIDCLSLVVPSEKVAPCLYSILGELEKQLRPDNLHVTENISIVAAVGRKMVFRPGTSGRIFAALGEHGINIRMISQGPDELNIIVGVDTKDFAPAIQVLYNSFVK